MTEREASGRRRDARARRRPEAHADGAGRARLPLRGSRRRAVAARAVRRAQSAHPVPVLLRGGRRRLARRRVRRLLVLRRRHPRARPPPLPRHHLRDGIAGATGEPAPLRRADGLDRRALVHDPHRALLGRLRGRRVVRPQRLPARRRRRLPHLLPPARTRWSSIIGSIWSLLSLTPYGGQSEDEDAPEGWPQAPDSFWFRRHDEFDDPPPSAGGGRNVIFEENQS